MMSDKNPRRLLREIEAEASVVDSSLKVTDTRLTGSVFVHTDDGSTFLWDSAFAVLADEGEWLVVFTEHHGFHVYALNGVVLYRCFQEVKALGADWQRPTT